MQQLIIGNVRYGLCGFVLLIISYALFFFDPVEIIKSAKIKFVEGSFVYQLWQKPPVKLYVNVYIFNVTNADRFLSGEDDKMDLQEIGPYVYWEELENTNATFNSNDTVSFTPRRQFHFDHNLSIGNPETDRIIVPNIPLLGFGSMLRNSPMFVNIVFNSLVEYLDSKPILELTVKEFLWGYDDQLVKMASNALPTWIDFSRFGLLDRMLDEGDNIVTMNLRTGKELKPYSLQQFNGSPILKQWIKRNDFSPETNEQCLFLNQTSDGLLFPRHITTDMSFPLYRKTFCRPLTFTFNSESKTSDGYPMYLYKFPLDIFNSSLEKNLCYCPPDGCLPSGLSDISPCYYNIPVAISFPHFYNGDLSLTEGVNGLSPDKKKHESVFGIQPDLGIPLEVNIKIQLNVVIKSTRYVKRIQKFNDITLPVFWLHLEMKSLPSSLESLLNLCFNVGPALMKAVIALAASAGFYLIGVSIIRLGKDNRRQQSNGQPSTADFEYGAGGDEDDYGGGLIVRTCGQLTSSQHSVASGKAYLPLHTSSVVADYDYSSDPTRGR